jgi:hypothetical protein
VRIFLDVLVLDRPVVLAASKDRPILFTALASADVLLTLDKVDFGGLLGGAFYGRRLKSGAIKDRMPCSRCRPRV